MNERTRAYIYRALPLVIAVLLLLLGHWRAALLVALAIPLSFLLLLTGMAASKASANLMSLGALDFGIIIDGAVIIVEAVMHQLSHSKKLKNESELSQKKMDKEVQTSASKMMNSAVFGQIIILIVYLPIFTLKELKGKCLNQWRKR